MDKPLSLVARLVPPAIFVPVVAVQYRFFEPELRHLADFVPADRAAVDVGAWWGPWSWWLARRVPEVHAFEPNVGVADGLRRALPGNVDLRNVAVSDRTGTAVLWSPGRGRGTEGRSSLAPGGPSPRPPRGRSGWTSQGVGTVTLDQLDFTDIGFVKIDVEGHELAVLRGASQLLERERPNVLVEVEQAHHGDGDFDQVFGHLEQAGYAGWFLRSRRWRPLAEFDREEARVAGERRAAMGLIGSTLRGSDRYVHNFLFRPRDH